VAPFLIVNRNSGDGGADELVAAARDRGIRVHVLAEGDDMAELARAADTDALAVAGGDGSLAPVAAVAIERDLPFAVVPFGTRNHFARDLGLDPHDAEAGLEVVVDGEERRIDVGRANDRLFLNNVSMGVYARLVHRREEHRRRRDALARLKALAIVARQRHPIGLTVDGSPVRARVVLVSNNAYSVDLLSIGERESLEEGTLHLYTVNGVLRTDWHERSGGQFVVDSRSHVVGAAVDGEPEQLETPIDFRCEPRALRVLVPRRPPA
jgi:diacylglycerol kinase family enzyme